MNIIYMVYIYFTNRKSMVIIYFSQSLQLYIKKKEVNLELLVFNIYIYTNIYSESCLNRTLNKPKSCIYRTLNKVPML